MEHVESLLKTTLGEIERLLNTRTVVGEPIKIEGTTVIPFISVGCGFGAAENLHLVERFTRLGPETVNWEMSVNDSTTFTRPWSAMIPLKRSEDAVYEFACHEGNYAMEGILSGHRAQEKAATAASR